MTRAERTDSKRNSGSRDVLCQTQKVTQRKRRPVENDDRGGKLSKRGCLLERPEENGIMALNGIAVQMSGHLIENCQDVNTKCTEEPGPGSGDVNTSLKNKKSVMKRGSEDGKQTEEFIEIAINKSSLRNRNRAMEDNGPQQELRRIGYGEEIKEVMDIAINKGSLRKRNRNKVMKDNNSQQLSLSRKSLRNADGIKENDEGTDAQGIMIKRSLRRNHRRSLNRINNSSEASKKISIRSQDNSKAKRARDTSSQNKARKRGRFGNKPLCTPRVRKRSNESNKASSLEFLPPPPLAPPKSPKSKKLSYRTQGEFREGGIVEALYEDRKWYDVKIAKRLDFYNFQVIWLKDSKKYKRPILGHLCYFELRPKSKKPIYNEKRGMESRLAQVLWELRRIPDAWPFREPVDPEIAPDYLEKIDYPMDLLTMKERLSKGAYKDVRVFAADFHLIVSNCKLYNGSSQFSHLAQSLQSKYREIMRQYLPRVRFEMVNTTYKLKKRSSMERIIQKSPCIGSTRIPSPRTKHEQNSLETNALCTNAKTSTSKKPKALKSVRQNSMKMKPNASRKKKVVPENQTKKEKKRQAPQKQKTCESKFRKGFSDCFLDFSPAVPRPNVFRPFKNVRQIKEKFNQKMMEIEEEHLKSLGIYPVPNGCTASAWKSKLQRLYASSKRNKIPKNKKSKEKLPQSDANSGNTALDEQKVGEPREIGDNGNSGIPDDMDRDVEVSVESEDCTEKKDHHSDKVIQSKDSGASCDGVKESDRQRDCSKLQDMERHRFPRRKRKAPVNLLLEQGEDLLVKLAIERSKVEHSAPPEAVEKLEKERAKARRKLKEEKRKQKFKEPRQSTMTKRQQASLAKAKAKKLEAAAKTEAAEKEKEKRRASRAAAIEKRRPTEPCMGMRVRVRFDDGMSYRGRIGACGIVCTRPRIWRLFIKYDDGESSYEIFPDPKMSIELIPYTSIDRSICPLSIGDKCDSRDWKGSWYPATVVDTDPDNPYMFKIHFFGWAKRWDEWIDFMQEPDRLAPLYNCAKPTPRSLRMCPLPPPPPEPIIGLLRPESLEQINLHEKVVKALSKTSIDPLMKWGFIEGERVIDRFNGVGEVVGVQSGQLLVLFQGVGRMYSREEAEDVLQRSPCHNCQENDFGNVIYRVCATCGERYCQVCLILKYAIKEKKTEYGWKCPGCKRLCECPRCKLRQRYPGDPEGMEPDDGLLNIKSVQRIMKDWLPIQTIDIPGCQKVSLESFGGSESSEEEDTDEEFYLLEHLKAHRAEIRFWRQRELEYENGVQIEDASNKVPQAPKLHRVKHLENAEEMRRDLVKLNCTYIGKHTSKKPGKKNRTSEKNGKRGQLNAKHSKGAGVCSEEYGGIVSDGIMPKPSRESGKSAQRKFNYKCSSSRWIKPIKYIRLLS